MLAAASPAFADPITLRALMEDVPETQDHRKLLPEFTKETGIKVEFERSAMAICTTSWSRQLVAPKAITTCWRSTSSGPASSPGRRLAGRPQPLCRKSGFDLKPFIPSMLDLLGRTPDALPILPMYNYSMGPDLPHRPHQRCQGQGGLQGQDRPGNGLPATLADYVALSKFFKAQGGDVVGAAMQGSAATRTRWSSRTTCSPRAAPISTAAASGAETARRASIRAQALSATTSKTARSRAPFRPRSTTRCG